MTLVVDASVAAKWLLAESGSESALELLAGSTPLVAPSIIRIEVAGAISRRFREGKLSESTARAGMSAWKKVLGSNRIELISTSALFEIAVELSFRCRHTITDSLYLAVASEKKIELITADRILHERADAANVRTVLFDSDSKATTI